MKNSFRFQKRKGIGNVITTLIILIASVVLGAGVIFFGGSLFNTNTQQESIQVSNAHIWVNDTSSVAAFAVQNTGGKVVSIQSISIRGQTVPTTSWFYDADDANATSIQKEFVYDNDFTDGIDVDQTGTVQYTVTQASGPISINQGKAVIIYLAEPAGIGPIDTGLSYTMNIQAGKVSAVQSVSVVNG